MKKQLLSLNYGNKRGFIFSLDLLIATTVVLLLIAASLYYFTRSSGSSASRLQMVKTGSDILAILDYGGTLQTLSMPEIGEELNELLPINHHMKIEIVGDAFGPLVIETTSEIPEDRFVVSGKRIFNVNVNYYIARYWIWLK